MFFNKMALIILLCTALMSAGKDLSAQAQYAYAIYFTDKNETTFQLNQPQQYLSTYAINRRVNQQITIDSSDLPVNAIYIDSVLNHTNSIFHNQSKWLNCTVILTTDTSKINDIRQFDFVQTVTKIGYFNLPLHNITPIEPSQPKTINVVQHTSDFDENYYGKAWQQIALTGGQILHQYGMEGQNMIIGVIDAGFKGVDTIEAFQHLFADNKIIDQYNFNRNTNNIYIDGQHGTQVLSTMAAFAPGKIVGTAPKATYALYYTEHSNSEQPIELYNLVAALERADSVGCQVINISLGYNEFDNPSDDFTYGDLNGSTTVAAKGVNYAFNKGIACIVASGNEGNSSWKHILTPADAIGALTVGSVDEHLNPSHFTGLGFTNTSKPDVAGMGSEAAIVKNDGTVVRSFGTSFATPIIAGLVACYMQAFPSQKNNEVYEYIKSIGHLGISGFNNAIGTGVPNFSNVMSNQHYDNASMLIYPNPAIDKIYIHNSTHALNYNIYNASGILMKNGTIDHLSFINIESLSAGIYMLQLSDGTLSHTKIFIKN